MLYQRLRRRVLANCTGPAPKFPCEAEVLFELIPPWAFGTKDGGSLSRASFCDVDSVSGKRVGEIHVDKHRGRAWAPSKNPLRPLAVGLKGPNQSYALHGTQLTMRVTVSSLDELDQKIGYLYYWLPVYLNLDFGDPPGIASVTVSFGESTGIWVPQLSSGTVFAGDQSTQQAFVQDALARVLIEASAEPRLLAALEYFYSATRLITSGETPGEFLAEAILNFAKILEALFSGFKVGGNGSIDKARAGLRHLGYEDELIEDFFVPAIALRNCLGVGHPALALVSPDDLEAVHWYADSAESHFRQLLKNVVGLSAPERAFLSSTLDQPDKALATVLSRIRIGYERSLKAMSIVTVTSAPDPIAPTTKYK